MRPRFYPAFLDLRGRRVLVIGGGKIAGRKAKDLAACGALVRVVAPRVEEGTARYASQLARRRFRATDLDGAALVVCACGDVAVDARVSALCRRRRVWANVVDRPALCDFIVPAVARRGRLAVAVSTGGASPALARALRRRLETGFLRARDARLAETLARKRPALLRLPIGERRRAVARLLEADA